MRTTRRTPRTLFHVAERLGTRDTRRAESSLARRGWQRVPLDAGSPPRAVAAFARQRLDTGRLERALLCRDDRGYLYLAAPAAADAASGPAGGAP